MTEPPSIASSRRPAAALIACCRRIWSAWWRTAHSSSTPDQLPSALRRGNFPAHRSSSAFTLSGASTRRRRIASTGSTRTPADHRLQRGLLVEPGRSHAAPTGTEASHRPDRRLPRLARAPALGDGLPDVLDRGLPRRVPDVGLEAEVVVDGQHPFVGTGVPGVDELGLGVALAAGCAKFAALIHRPMAWPRCSLRTAVPHCHTSCGISGCHDRVVNPANWPVGSCRAISCMRTEPRSASRRSPSWNCSGVSCSSSKSRPSRGASFIVSWTSIVAWRCSSGTGPMKSNSE